jgi:hypothetical protein
MRVLALLLGILSIQAFAGEVRLPDAFIYESTSCYGGCPPYQVTVLSDGTATFELKGDERSIVKLPGSPDLFANILSLTQEYRIREFRDEYGFVGEEVCKEEWSDNPSTIMSLQVSGEVKTIHHYHGCRGFYREQELNELEDKLKTLLQVESYLGAKR